MNKIKYIVFVLVLFVSSSCYSKKEIRPDTSFIVLFSNRYEADFSYLLSFDDKGRVIDEKKIGGYRYQSLMDFNKKIYIYNGKHRYIFDYDMVEVESRVNEDDKESSIEMSGYNNNSNNYYYINNYGDDGSGYCSYVEVDGKDSIKIEGRVLTHVMINDMAFILYDTLEASSFTPRYVMINIEEGLITDLGILPNSFVVNDIKSNPYVTEKGEVFFIADYIDAEDTSKVTQKLIKYNIHDNLIESEHLIQKFSINKESADYATPIIGIEFSDNFIYLIGNGYVEKMDYELHFINKFENDFITSDYFMYFDFDSHNDVLSMLKFEELGKIMTLDLNNNDFTIMKIEENENVTNLLPYGFLDMRE